MGGLKTFWSRVVALFWRRELDRDLEDELRSHIEIASEENRRSGMPDEKARQKAMRDFGGLTQVRETVRTGEGLPFFGCRSSCGARRATLCSDSI